MNIPEGTIFRFTDRSARRRGFQEGPWDQLCVAVFEDELKHCKGKYRRLACKGYHTGAIDELPLESVELVGLMPKSAMGAISWDDSFAFPHGLKPGAVIQFNTRPEWWTCKNWNERMVVMFRDRCDQEFVRIRRMKVDNPYHSRWDPTKDSFEVVGQLTPDQLHVTESTVGLKPKVSEQPHPRVDPRFTEGAVFRLTGDSKPNWWIANPDSWNKPCVVIELGRSRDDGGVPFRLLSELVCFDYRHFRPDVDAFEIVGQLPESKRNSTDFDDVVRLPTQADEKPAQLPVGTRFRFREIPDRWDHIPEWVSTNTEFEVVDHKDFKGAGQCIVILKNDTLDGCIYSLNNGVSWADDCIEIVAHAEPARTTTTWREWSIVQIASGWHAWRGDSGSGHDIRTATLSVLLDRLFAHEDVGGEVSIADLHARIASLSKENGELREANELANKRTARLKQQQKQEVERLVAKIQELEKDNGELKGVNWKNTACDLEKKVESLEKANHLLNIVVDDWKNAYDRAHETISQLSEKKPNAALAFFKKMW